MAVLLVQVCLLSRSASWKLALRESMNGSL